MHFKKIDLIILSLLFSNQSYALFSQNALSEQAEQFEIFDYKSIYKDKNISLDQEQESNNPRSSNQTRYSPSLTIREVVNPQAIKNKINTLINNKLHITLINENEQNISYLALINEIEETIKYFRVKDFQTTQDLLNSPNFVSRTIWKIADGFKEKDLMVAFDLFLIGFGDSGDANISSPANNFKFTQLMKAAAQGDLDKLEDLILKTNQKIDKRDLDKQTALMWAIIYGQPATAKALLLRQAKTDIVNLFDHTPLSLAVINNSPNKRRLVNLLLAFEADPTIANHAGVTPLMFASSWGMLDIVEIFCVYQETTGVDLINIKSKDGKSALIYALESKAEDKIEVALNLLDYGADPNTVYSKIDRPALSLASYFGLRKVVNKLLEKGADPKLKDKDGKRALDYAEANHQYRIMQQLSNYDAYNYSA